MLRTAVRLMFAAGLLLVAACRSSGSARPSALTGESRLSSPEETPQLAHVIRGHRE